MLGNGPAAVGANRSVLPEPASASMLKTYASSCTAGPPMRWPFQVTVLVPAGRGCPTPQNELPPASGAMETVTHAALLSVKLMAVCPPRKVSILRGVAVALVMNRLSMFSTRDMAAELPAQSVEVSRIVAVPLFTG